MIGSQHPGMCLRSVEELSVGRETSVALSTAEAEYMALASTAQEAMWMRQLTADLKKCTIKSHYHL